MTVPPETMAWLHQAARIDGATYAQVLLMILERLELLEAALQQSTVKESSTAGPTPEAAPVATDEELCSAYNNAPEHNYDHPTPSPTQPCRPGGRAGSGC